MAAAGPGLQAEAGPEPTADSETQIPPALETRALALSVAGRQTGWKCPQRQGETEGPAFAKPVALEMVFAGIPETSRALTARTEMQVIPSSAAFLGRFSSCHPWAPIPPAGCCLIPLTIVPSPSNTQSTTESRSAGWDMSLTSVSRVRN